MMLACRATSPFSLPRAYLIGRLSVCPCVVSFSKLHGPDMHDLTRTSREDPESILVRHARFPRDMLAICSRGSYEENAPWNFSFTNA